MEGITGYIFRNVHSMFFHKADKYFTPFLAPNRKRIFKTRELEDILPEHNKGISVVPQILTSNAEDFILATKELKQYGYQEVNLNLGCPSGTVVSKGRGSGFLAKTEELERFFDTVFSEQEIVETMFISVKTRIGKDSPEEFYKLIEIFNNYPIAELTIHPRTQKDYYKNQPNWDIFADAVKLSKSSLCYNGNLFTILDYQEFTEKFPEVPAVMFGRGLLSNPALLSHIKGEAIPEKRVFREFHDKLYQDYKQVLPGDMPVLFKMKEFWSYFITIFYNSERYAKEIRKAKNLIHYENTINNLFLKTELQVINNRE